MANIKNFGLIGVGSDVQFGKSGPRLINSSGVFQFHAQNGTDWADIAAGNLNLAGDLTVQGTTTTVNSTTVTIADKNIEIGNGATTDAAADGGGLTLDGLTQKTFQWALATNSWTSSENLDLASAKTYKIAGTDVLSATTLGAGVVNSSLTSVGNLVNLHVVGTSTLDGAVTAGSTLAVTGTTTLGNLTVGASKTVDFGSNVLTNVGTGVAGTDGVNVGQLNAAISAVSTGAIAGLQTEVDAIETSVGLNNDGTFTAPTGTTFLGSTTTVMGGLVALDSALNTANGAVTAETAARTAADAQEVTDRNTAIAAEATARDAAILVETNRAEAAETAIAGNLSAEVTRAEGVEASIQAELDAAEAAIGLAADGTLVAFQTGGAVAGKTTYLAAVNALDSAVSALNTGSTAAVAAETTRAEGIENAIIAAVGLNSDGTLVAFQTGGAVAGKTTVEAAINALDTALTAASAATASEATTARAAELVLTNNLAAEVTRAEAAETALGLRIDDLTTDVVAEGTTNLYFTASRARAALSVDTTPANTGLLYNATTGVFGVDQTVIATVASVTAGDASTLAAAKAYTDANVAGKTANAAQIAYAPFAFGDTAVTVQAAVTGFVHRVKVYVNTAFTDATSSIQVGTVIGGTAVANALVATSDTDATIAACYIVEIATPVAAADLVINVAGATSTAGAGYVVIEWI